MLKPLLILSALVACACVSAKSSSTNSAPNGGAIFRASRCADCHATDLTGSKAGPSLEGLSANWTRSELTEFLADPAAVVSKDARLGALNMQYSQDMPAYDDLSSKQRDALAGWLLTK